MLDRAEGVLMAVRHVGISDAFAEIVSAARRRGVPALRMARALVELASGAPPRDEGAGAAAQAEWAACSAADRR